MNSVQLGAWQGEAGFAPVVSISEVDRGGRR